MSYHCRLHKVAIKALLTATCSAEDKLLVYYKHGTRHTQLTA